MKKTVMTALFATLTGSMALAQSATDQIVSDLTAQGFQRIEIDNGIGQIKVEAIRGTQKLEVVYDRATGDILKQEVESVRGDDDTRPGVEIRNRARDFVDIARADDLDEDDDVRGRGDRGRSDEARDERGRSDEVRGERGRSDEARGRGEDDDLDDDDRDDGRDDDDRDDDRDDARDDDDDRDDDRDDDDQDDDDDDNDDDDSGDGDDSDDDDDDDD